MVNISRIVANPVVWGLVFIFSLPFWAGSGKRGEQIAEIRKTAPLLVEQCNNKAVGGDGIFSFEEGVDLARGLGWNFPIYSGEKVSLKFDHGWASSFLLVGYNPTPGLLEPIARSCKAVSIEEMKNYLMR